jgi:hypothetical protein
MALPTTYGDSHVFGVLDSGIFVTIQTDSVDQKPALDVEVMDETGRVITDRLDDQRTETTVSGVLKTGGTVPVAGNQFNYDGIQYIIKGVTNDGANNAFRKVTLKLVKYQEIA